MRIDYHEHGSNIDQSINKSLILFVFGGKAMEKMMDELSLIGNQRSKKLLTLLEWFTVSTYIFVVLKIQLRWTHMT